MGAIRVLDENVANQIAAGEVVERPASVVKELLENALDAGASRIDVEVEGGGADRIRVADNGSGMERDDALLALERHATSKIREAADLKAIVTFGFRGEALPSIASVSRMTLTTATGPATGGVRVEVRAGRVERAGPAAHPRGTTVQVEALFHNAPARRKFLRSAATETARIVEIVTAIAAVQPAIGITLKSGGRTLASYPSVPSHRERAAQIVGPDEAALLPVEGRSGTLRITGLASAPSLHRSTSRDQHLFVNDRPVRDRRVQHAVQQAYATLLPKGRFAVVYLFLEVPSLEVDVNVHPAKSEVRFLHPGAIHDLVREALVSSQRAARPFPALGRVSCAVGEPEPGGTVSPWAAPPAAVPSSRGRDEAALPVPGGAGRIPAAGDLGLGDAVPIEPLVQFRDSYILAAAPEGLVILDQHAAHERILYERFMRESLAGRVERQRLLFPLVLRVSPARRQAFEEGAGTIESLGFSIAPFGEEVLKIDEVPALIPAAGVERLVQELLDEVLEWRKTEGIDRLRHRVVSTAACHAAVTANHPLALPEMGRIVSDLMRTESPMTCPHGRPVLLRLTLDQLEKEFRRK